MTTESFMDRHLLQRLQELLDRRLGDERFGVKDLAREIGLSKSQLLRKLRALKGKSTSQFIREYRLERAMDLLRQRKGTASEIGYLVGFSSPTYFSSCFHEYFGYPPGEVKYRNTGHEIDKGRPAGVRPSAYAKKRKLLLSFLGLVLLVVVTFVIYIWEGCAVTKVLSLAYSPLS